MPETELQTWIEHWLASLARENASAHTVRNYRADLEQFSTYFSRSAQAPPVPEDFDQLMLREWLADLHRMNLARHTIRRKLSAVRGLFDHLLRRAWFASITPSCF